MVGCHFDAAPTAWLPALPLTTIFQLGPVELEASLESLCVSILTPSNDQII
jgi:hypothetical protein